jgi:RND superfamily putative drug exporter
VIFGDGSANRLDFKNAAARDLKVIVPLVLAVILITLVLLLRALVTPLYLLATVVLSFLGTLGLSVLLYRVVLGAHSFDPELPIFAFIFLVALGSDYNIFLMSRVREEAATVSTREAALRAVAVTGPVITSAGIVLAGTFAVLTVLPITILIEVGIAVALGVLLDTFLVRTLLVPAIASIVGEASWWPARRRDAAPEAARGTVGG